ncbi:hypothetical protein AAF712_010498 [Marasmius tenuissimus]|uniref:Uncharacterized protein n=1 Tax=Marasmius tenuissimus TaxID=585030 RepID=A0ABR2ZLU8_9AGAR
MFAFKTILIVVSATVARLAAPKARRQLAEDVRHVSIARPPPHQLVKLTWFRRSITGGLNPEHNSNGSYTATGTIAADGLTADELKALVTAWPASSKTLQGLLYENGERLVWVVNAVTCD